ncbi:MULTISPECIES: SLATT domain-containing protein [Streptomyces]|uniref:SLATT domain-containing protein n=1 Tax=Streptomyces TaxID=1883 RepID=UPI001F60A86C|nr:MULTISPECIES: SLATT domain-containing protein [Streptomyces]
MDQDAVGRRGAEERGVQLPGRGVAVPGRRRRAGAAGAYGARGIGRGGPAAAHPGHRAGDACAARGLGRRLLCRAAGAASDRRLLPAQGRRDGAQGGGGTPCGVRPGGGRGGARRAGGRAGGGGAAAWVAVVVTAGAAVSAHGVAAKYAFQEMEYARTADELRRLVARRGAGDGGDGGPEADDAFVARCERVISVLNDTWMIKWTTE